MSELKNFSVKILPERHEDLLLIQEYYSKKVGFKLNQTQALEKLFFEVANVIKNTDDLKFDFSKKEEV